MNPSARGGGGPGGVRRGGPPRARGGAGPGGRGPANRQNLHEMFSNIKKKNQRHFTTAKGTGVSRTLGEDGDPEKHTSTTSDMV